MKFYSLSQVGSRRRFRARLLHWYDRHQRRLPWRATRDPYRIWVSEIMLQQTRVGAVQERYREFLRRFPTLRELAEARPAAVLAAWSGLGYYRRARALHATARQAVRDCGGRLPASAAALRQLPGIGRYTAAAVASIAFGEACAAVDGNIERVLRRLLGSLSGSVRELWTVAEELLARRRPGDFNQAMMELGATLCLPASPRCEACPVSAWCATRGPLESSPKPVRQARRVTYALAATSKGVCLVRRPASSSMMPGMWELPLARGGSRASPVARLRHAITTTDYQVGVVRSPRRPPGTKVVAVSRLPAMPLTGLTCKILRRFELL